MGSIVNSFNVFIAEYVLTEPQTYASFGIQMAGYYTQMAGKEWVLYTNGGKGVVTDD